MARFRPMKSLILAGALLLLSSTRAAAYPLLQFDVSGGTYDWNLEETVAGSETFTLYAYLTDPSAADLAATYYIAVALTPQVYPPGGNFGTFSIDSTGAANQFTYVDNYTTGSTTTTNSTTIAATEDMIYGNPPLETYLGYTAGEDSGDLSDHGIYDTYFMEFSFTFNQTQTAIAYDAQYSTADGPTTSSTGTMYYMAFTISTEDLANAYQLHFDMYNEALKNDSDLDVKKFAPFSHSARSAPAVTPEPGSLFLLGTGIAALAVRRRRAHRQS